MRGDTITNSDLFLTRPWPGSRCGRPEGRPTAYSFRLVLVLALPESKQNQTTNADESLQTQNNMSFS